MTNLLLAGAALIASARLAAALADARARARDWPVHRCGPAVPLLLAHDLAVGLATYLLFVALPLVLLGLPAGRWEGVALIGVGVGVSSIVGGRMLRRRRGVPITAIGRPGAFAALAAEPVPTLRATLLDRVDHAAERASNRWLTDELYSCRRRARLTDDHLLPAVWSPARIRLRETVGAGRTEVALLLLQAQSVVDDESPPTDRLFTLLHLVYQRGGRPAVRAVLDAAAHGPLRHGPQRSGPRLPGPRRSGASRRSGAPRGSGAPRSSDARPWRRGRRGAVDLR